jgi:hypothetical protein
MSYRSPELHTYAAVGGHSADRPYPRVDLPTDRCGRALRSVAFSRRPHWRHLTSGGSPAKSCSTIRSPRHLGHPLYSIIHVLSRPNLRSVAWRSVRQIRVRGNPSQKRCRAWEGEWSPPVDAIHPGESPTSFWAGDQNRVSGDVPAQVDTPHHRPLPNAESNLGEMARGCSDLIQVHTTVCLWVSRKHGYGGCLLGGMYDDRRSITG